MSTSAGIITPLTLERFRICELYAELLHCSNMCLLNRPAGPEHYLYDSDGYLAGGWRKVEELNEALSGYPADEEDRGESRLQSPMMATRPFSDHSSPIDVALTYSGASTPSAAGSLDSESGILTRAEARELRDLLACSAANPFDDPDSDVVELREAIGSMGIGQGSAVVECADVRERIRTVKELPRGESKDRKRGRASSTGTLPAGQLLKREFIRHRIPSTMLVSYDSSRSAIRSH